LIALYSKSVAENSPSSFQITCAYGSDIPCREKKRERENDKGKERGRERRDCEETVYQCQMDGDWACHFSLKLGRI